ncbi:carbohydrate kinase family protein [Marinomonas spartinae]|uniref:carbohydrate kinase family protein n=1 Tax=Marinomonas spartinae TaxID=1792290 RepID=UPI0018F1F283|nr:sugar kinase [Marinomonas spartinae]MBJ7556491.1 sugar kinase [Marinomonas spartinae]
MPSFDVSSVGFAVLDILGYPVSRIPEGGHADFIEQIRMTVAGTAAATAVDCAILGLNTRMVSTVGTDEMGDFLINKMNLFGLDTALVRRDDSVQTSATILPVRPNGERPALHVPGTAATFDVAEEDMEAALDANIIHIGGTGLLQTFDGVNTLNFMQKAKALGRITTFDLIQATPETTALVLPLLSYIDYFIPSIEEASAMAGLASPIEVARWFKERGVKNVILTMGSEGVYVDPDQGLPFSLAAHDIEVVDTTGCGDSFSAGVIVGLAKGWTLQESVRFAGAVAAKVAMGLGSDGKLISFDDTLHAMNSWPLKTLKAPC